MNNTHTILGLAMLIFLVTVLALALAEFPPTLIASVGWHDLVSVGWVG